MKISQQRIQDINEYLNGSYWYYEMNKTMNLNRVKLGKVL